MRHRPHRVGWKGARPAERSSRVTANSVFYRYVVRFFAAPPGDVAAIFTFGRQLQGTQKGTLRRIYCSYLKQSCLLQLQQALYKLIAY